MSEDRAVTLPGRHLASPAIPPVIDARSSSYRLEAAIFCDPTTTNKWLSACLYRTRHTAPQSSGAVRCFIQKRALAVSDLGQTVMTIRLIFFYALMTISRASISLR